MINTVRKIKSVTPDYNESSGPSEIIRLGIEIDGTSIMFGKFYIGPGMIEWHEQLMKKMEEFIDECILKFKEN